MYEALRVATEPFVTRQTTILISELSNRDS